MRNLRLLNLFLCLLLTVTAAAQDLPAHDTITLQAADDITLVADFYPAPPDSSM